MEPNPRHGRNPDLSLHDLFFMSRLLLLETVIALTGDLKLRPPSTAKTSILKDGYASVKLSLPEYAGPTLHGLPNCSMICPKRRESGFSALAVPLTSTAPICASVYPIWTRIATVLTFS